VLPEKFHVVRKEVTAMVGRLRDICTDPDTCHINPSMRQNVLVVLVFVLLWLVPSGLLYLYAAAPVFLTEAVFFTKAAFLTFAGPMQCSLYRPGRVEQYSWLTAEQMIDGLGLAETTPGP